MENTKITVVNNTLELFQTNKEERQQLVDVLLKEITDGNKNPLLTHLQIKAIEDFTEKVKENKDYKEEVLKEARKLLGGSKSIMAYNAKVEISEVGTQYDFSNCNDTEYLTLLLEATKANEKLKARQTFLKNVPSEGTRIVDNDGEVCMVYPPSKTSTTAVKITLK